MERPKCWLFTLFTLFLSTVVFSQQDTTPPTYSWLSPLPFSVLTTNTIRLSVDAQDGVNGSGIEKVIFSTQYWTTEGKLSYKQVIGEVVQFPYEFIWDCAGIPDQDYGKLFIFCEVIDKSGNVNAYPNGSANIIGPLCVLDRNQDISDKTLKSQYTRKKITIDGNLEEWVFADSIEFSNNDNRIITYSLWNTKYLYFGIRVEDKRIISNFFPDTEVDDYMPREDIVEIYIDANHDHNEIRGRYDKSYLFAAGGKMYKRIPYRDGDVYISIKEEIFNGAVTVNGTLNDATDTDSLYTIETAVSWKELGVDPEKITSMGLELWNNDKDYVEGHFFMQAGQQNLIS